MARTALIILAIELAVIGFVRYGARSRRARGDQPTQPVVTRG
jgi:hypothetical protein